MINLAYAMPPSLSSEGNMARQALVPAPGDVPPSRRNHHRCIRPHLDDLQRFLAIQARSTFYSYPYIQILLEVAKSSLTNTRVSASGYGLETNVPQTTALRALNELEKAGLVRRTPDPADRRRSHVTATDTGIDTVTGFIRQLFEVFPDPD